jgi:hypothetical protein
MESWKLIAVLKLQNVVHLVAPPVIHTCVAFKLLVSNQVIKGREMWWHVRLTLEMSLIFSTPFGIASSSIIRRCHYSPLPFASTLYGAEFFVLQIVWEERQEVMGMSLYTTELHVAWIYKVVRFVVGSDIFRMPSLPAYYLHHFQ